jgi:eukaryotic-like serine/threonine-protein kinase
MSADLTEVLFTAVRESQLLEPARLTELREYIQNDKPDPAKFVKEIRRRGMLSDFQIKEIARGRGKELSLGPYTLLELLGEGGMGRVFKAHHNRLGRDVALKVIRKEKLAKPSVVQRFHQEIRAAAQLSHPNVVLAFDADESGGIHYFAMEFVEGTDLTKIVRASGPIRMPLACDYIRQAAIGLQHAYERGLVHRDVKPSNLLLTPKGQIKLLDLGLAMLNELEDGANRVTQEGLVLGTPDFLAPEQAQNPTGVDIRADIYAMGASLFYLITGKVPFEGTTPTDKMMQHVTAPPPRLRDHRPDAPEQLDLLIQWLMAKKPEDRPQTPAQVAAILQPYCPANTSHTPISLTGIGAVGLLQSNPHSPVEIVPPQQVSAPADLNFAAPLPSTQEIGRAVSKPRASRKAMPGWVKTVLVIAAIGAMIVCGVGGIGYILLSNVLESTKPLPKEFTTTQGVKLVQLAGGSVLLGSATGSPGHESHEAPAVTVNITGPFFMSATEVTQGQFIQVMGKSPAKWATRLKDSKSAPVDSVTYDEAIEFCKKLTAADRANQRTGWAYRLPTEAEWEYASRAGGTGPFTTGDKLIYGKTGIFSLDKELASKGTLGEEDFSKPNMEKNLPYPVKTTEPNGFGLYDMHGNVWEWVADYYEPGHATANSTDPQGPANGDWRVQKSGSWREPASLCRTTARRGLPPDARKDDAGFRVVFAPVAKK